MNDRTATLSAGQAGRRQFVSFVVTGGIAAIVNLGVRWLLSLMLVYEVAVTLAYLVGMTTAFLLARSFVFRPETGDVIGEYCRFAAVNVVSFLVVLGVSVGLARMLFPAIGFAWHPEDVAHLIGVVSPILLSYYAHKYFSFGRRAQRA